VQRIVLASTTSVYEPALPAETVLREDARRARSRPLTYGFTKKWAEDAAHLQALLAEPSISLWVLRPGVVVGPGLRPASWLRSTLGRVQSGEPYPLTGERGHHLGLVALEDVVDALAVAIGGTAPEGTQPPGPVWNLVGETWWEREVVEALAGAADCEPRFEPPSARDPFGWSEQPVSVAGDGSRWIREMGGIKPRPIAPLLAEVARDGD